jgi:hypothetical protein
MNDSKVLNVDYLLLKASATLISCKKKGVMFFFFQVTDGEMLIDNKGGGDRVLRTEWIIWTKRRS